MKEKRKERLRKIERESSWKSTGQKTELWAGPTNYLVGLDSTSALGLTQIPFNLHRPFIFQLSLVISAPFLIH